jgi:hypothetical protein
MSGSARVPLVLFGILACLARTSSAQPDSTEASQRPWAVGLSAGIPQLLAATVERTLVPNLHLQGNFGTILVLSSASARLLVLPDHVRFQPYGYVGGGTMFGFALEEDWEGWLPYAWYGFGLRYRFPRVILYVDFGGISAGSKSGELEDLGAYSAGILFRF